jgi:nucleotide-binding universal stress UspA family protein
MDHNRNSELTKFLLPIDGSESSNRAVSFAGCLISGLGGRVKGVTLLHVLAGHYLSTHMTNVDVRAGYLLESDVFKRLKEQHVASAVQPLVDAAEAELKRLGAAAPVDSRVVDGDPAEQIRQVGEEGAYSTIVMGRRGRNRVKELLLGSVTSKLLHQPHHVTTYVVGQRVLFEGACMLPRILVPLDGSPDALAAVSEAAVLGAGYGASLDRILLLRVIDLARYWERTGSGQPPEKEADQILQQGRQILIDAGVDEGKIEPIAKYGRPVEVILESADDNDVNLVVMGRRGRSTIKDLLAGSVSSEILHRCAGPAVAIVCGG